MMITPFHSKVCFKCSKLQPLTEFYIHKQMKDGHINKCKACAKLDVSYNYINNRLYYSKYDQERFKDQNRKNKVKGYQRARRLRDPLKYKARYAVSNAIRSKKIEKLPCNICGNYKSQAHHEDYSKPLEIIWLCFKCHREKYHQQVVTVMENSMPEVEYHIPALVKQPEIDPVTGAVRNPASEPAPQPAGPPNPQPQPQPPPQPQPQP